ASSPRPSSASTPSRPCAIRGVPPPDSDSEQIETGVVVEFPREIDNNTGLGRFRRPLFGSERTQESAGAAERRTRIVADREDCRPDVGDARIEQTLQLPAHRLLVAD